MKTSELRDLGPEELKGKEQDMRKELFNLRFQSATGDIQNPRRIRTVRRDIAKVKTLLGEKSKQNAEKDGK